MGCAKCNSPKTDIQINKKEYCMSCWHKLNILTDKWKFIE